MKKEDPPKPPADPGAKAKPHDHFVDLMLSGMAHSSRVPAPPHHRPPKDPYQALRQSRAAPHASYYLRRPTPGGQIRPESPALEVMTDLTRVTPVTTRSLATVDEAERTMISRGVRALFVVDDDGAVLGLITSTDVLGERPIQLAQQRGIRHDEVIVREVMTPADRLEAMGFEDVRRARVGDVVATLKLSGRQHALVVESAPDAAGSTVRGIFSLTQIARQLGLPARSAHDIAATFVALEAAIGS